MPENPHSSPYPGGDPVPGVCSSCRFGSGPERDCSLIMAGQLRELMDEGPTDVRLCKGIYIEPEEIAFVDPDEIRNSFNSLLEQLFDENEWRTAT